MRRSSPASPARSRGRGRPQARSSSPARAGRPVLPSGDRRGLPGGDAMEVQMPLGPGGQRPVLALVTGHPAAWPPSGCSRRRPGASHRQAEPFGAGLALAAVRSNVPLVIGGHVQGVGHGSPVVVEGTSVRAGDQPGDHGARHGLPPGQPEQDALVVRAEPDRPRCRRLRSAGDCRSPATQAGRRRCAGSRPASSKAPGRQPHPPAFPLPVDLAVAGAPKAPGLSVLSVRRQSAGTCVRSIDISEANEIAGSQLGSQRGQILSYARPQSASISAAKRHIRPQLAPSGDDPKVPSGQRVAGPCLPGARVGWLLRP